jgi:protein-tyrosine phosphatase
VLFHCAAGKDRTGLAAALLLDLAGVAEDEIIADYVLSAELLRPQMDEWLSRMAEREIEEQRALQLMAANADDMRTTLRTIERRWGSAAGYLASIGLDDGVVDLARVRLAA